MKGITQWKKTAESNEEAFHRETQMPNKYINLCSTGYLGQGEKPWFIALGGVNNSTMAAFKLPT